MFLQLDADKMMAFGSDVIFCFVHSMGPRILDLVLLWNIIQFSKATGRIKEAISALPVATKDDDIEEAVALKDETEEVNSDGQVNKGRSSPATFDGDEEEQPDPFGLDALISNAPKKEEKSKGKKEPLAHNKKDDDKDRRRFLKSQREALISCVEIAAKRYKTPWLNKFSFFMNSR